MTARPIQIQNFWRVPEIRLGAMVALLLAWCAALLTFRVLWTWKLHYTFLVWNLGLATMPLIFSTIFVHAQRRFISVTAFSLWLLFFPNAPYIITDFTHLQNHSSGPIWFDILLLFSSAAVGLIIGYISLSQVTIVSLLQTTGPWRESSSQSRPSLPHLAFTSDDSCDGAASTYFTILSGFSPTLRIASSFHTNTREPGASRLASECCWPSAIPSPDSRLVIHGRAGLPTSPNSAQRVLKRVASPAYAATATKINTQISKICG